VRQVKLEGFDGDAGCTLTAVTGGGGFGGFAAGAEAGEAVRLLPARRFR